MKSLLFKSLGMNGFENPVKGTQASFAFKLHLLTKYITS